MPTLTGYGLTIAGDKEAAKTAIVLYTNKIIMSKRVEMRRIGVLPVMHWVYMTEHCLETRISQFICYRQHD